MATNWAKLIDEQYDKMLSAQKAQLKAQYAQNTATYQKQLSDAAEKYQALRNEAYINSALTEKARRESIANMGLSGRGGTAQTLRQREQLELLRELGAVSRQQQDYTDNVNLALANLSRQYNADDAGLEAQTAAERAKALLEQSRWQADYDLAFERLKREQQNSAFEHAYSLYLKRLITAAQFKAMTGLTLR